MVHIQCEWVGDETSSPVYFYEWVYRSGRASSSQLSRELVAGKLEICLFQAGKIEMVDQMSAIWKYFKVLSFKGLLRETPSTIIRVRRYFSDQSNRTDFLPVMVTLVNVSIIKRKKNVICLRCLFSDCVGSGLNELTKSDDSQSKEKVIRTSLIVAYPQDIKKEWPEVKSWLFNQYRCDAV